MRARVNSSHAGFTLVELLVTLAIVAVLGVLTVPVLQISVQRAREAELRLALREIRSAIDAYKRAADAGEIVEPPAVTSGYPPNLELLAAGVAYRDERAKGRRYFLRRLPRNPMSDDPQASAAQTWALRSYDSDPTDPRPGADVFDIYSPSRRIGLNGTAYRDW